MGFVPPRLVVAKLQRAHSPMTYAFYAPHLVSQERGDSGLDSRTNLALVHLALGQQAWSPAGWRRLKVA